MRMIVLLSLILSLNTYAGNLSSLVAAPTASGLTACPAGMTFIPSDNAKGMNQFCIETSIRASAYPGTARQTCTDAGRTLCSPPRLAKAYSYAAATLGMGAGSSELSSQIYTPHHMILFDGSIYYISTYVNGGGTYYASYSQLQPYRCCSD